MIMLDTVDFPAVFLGAIRAGIVPVPLNTLLTAEQYAYVLADCRARVLFISEALLPVVKDIIGRMPDLEHVVVAGSDAHGHKKLSGELANESDSFTTVATHADEPAFWLYSSGSTGMPKGVRHLHCNLAATAETYARQVLGIREDDVGLSAAKLFFAYGLGNALTFPMSVGATTVLNSERPTPALMFALMHKYNPSIFFGVPTLFLRDAERRDVKERTRRGEVAPLHLRRRSAAGVGRQQLEVTLRRRHYRRRRYHRAVAYFSVERARRYQIWHIRPSGAGLQGAAGQ
jgi:4-hydroxybenzoate-CoA ligase